MTKRWSDRPVLLLLGIRLGLDGVNPVYYETVKVTSLVHTTSTY
jgi:cysteine protease ATG4